jgi:hypothetical protein
LTGSKLAVTLIATITMEHRNHIRLREKAIATGKLLTLFSELLEGSEIHYLSHQTLKKLRWKINVAVIRRMLNGFIPHPALYLL